MPRRDKRRERVNPIPPSNSPTTTLVVGAVLAVAWMIGMLAISSRMHHAFNYRVIPTVDSGAEYLEPFAASGAACALVIVVALVWFWLLAAAAKKSASKLLQQALLWMLLGQLPTLLWLLKSLDFSSITVHAWESLWICQCTGLSLRALILAQPKPLGPDQLSSGQLSDSQLSDGQRTDVQRSSLLGWPSKCVVSLWTRLVPVKGSLRRLILSDRAALLIIWLFGLGATWGWFHQSQEYHDNFMLGFNDFGHFVQRVANTAAGRGFLLETPVLPPFWDHFNPGILCLIPLWQLFPNAALVFVLQAAALACSAVVVFLIARRLQIGAGASLLFGVAWLAQPAVGQMNLAYTYGWHPITFAIPLLLVAIWALLSQRYAFAVVAALLAISMEEGVFVIVGLTAATSLVIYWRGRGGRGTDVQGSVAARDRLVQEASVPNPLVADPLVQRLTLAQWVAIAVLSLGGFVLVYRFSGLAEFQTGRFVALGNSLTEIALSPFLRPSVFWGQVLRAESLMFVLLLWLPCGVVTLFRGRRWLLPTLLPLGVLIVWDHRPAHSLAFQYPATLLPLFWLATLWGSSPTADRRQSSEGQQEHDWEAKRRQVANACSALAVGLTLSLFWGQLPYSGQTIIEVQGKSYGESLIRQRTQDDGQWLHAQLQPIRQQQEECLATGRIAAHLVGCRDIETVGQYLQRRDLLAKLPDRSKPILHYRWVILDRREGFQQTPEETDLVEAEARQAGFQTYAEDFDIVVLKR